MKILIFYQYFGTPNGGWSTRFYEFAKRWGNEGHQVTVVTSPYYKSDIKADKFISKQWIENIDLIVINSPDSNKAGLFRRMLNAFIFSSVSVFYALKLSYDVVLCSSGPITIALPGLAASVFRRKKFVFEVRDLWPRGAVELEKIKNPIAVKIGFAFEKWIYKNANLVVACSPGMEEGVLQVNAKSPTLVIPNSSDNDLFYLSESMYPDKFPQNWKGKSVFIYAGSLGLMDECSQIIKGISKVNHEDIKIAIIGDGAEREHLQGLVESLGLQETVEFFGLIPKREVVKWFSVAKASFVTFKDIPVLHTNSPNKMFDSFAAGVPIIQSTKGWIKDFVNETGCGINVDPNDPKTFSDAILLLHSQPEQRQAMADAAKNVAKETFDRGKLALRYLQRIKEL
ncbi:putative glycosyltransferase [Indibacter alkaliphilus LW1]|uniref:Glycosyltransferase n=1 Tax=Indibacter alkaliphilus (strain CCUG 57479 / KCTC 22604 / LW1) TaxID=1189612 RepID=S2DF48_INDAL|nr:glycosyltransferase family 4 protein [Indibacter alkaliphilus]EOZ95650.1 putative glycosyltransferase [Indibacter alkaliphilus LW1]